MNCQNCYFEFTELKNIDEKSQLAKCPACGQLQDEEQ